MLAEHSVLDDKRSAVCDVWVCEDVWMCKDECMCEGVFREAAKWVYLSAPPGKGRIFTGLVVSSQLCKCHKVQLKERRQ